MPLTDFCDVLGAIHEDGLNRIIFHVMSQRPSLFHYGTPSFVSDVNLLCCPPENVHLEVRKRGNPVVTRLDPLAIPGYNGNFGLEYNFSIASLAIDFEPSNRFTLPPEFDPPLKPQSVALQGIICGGIACPEKEVLDRLIMPVEPYTPNIKSSKHGENKGHSNLPENEQKALQGFPFNKVHCFRLEFYVAVNFTREDNFGEQMLSMKFQKLELVDLRPEELENSIECLIRTTLILGIFPKFSIALKALTYSIEDFISVGPTDISAQVPFNPSVENDTLTVKLSINPA